MNYLILSNVIVFYALPAISMSICSLLLECLICKGLPFT